MHKLALLLGRFWSYMTPEYIFSEMTWNEIGAGLDFIYRYEITDNHVKGSIKLNDWLYKGRDTLSDALKKITGKLRGK